MKPRLDKEMDLKDLEIDLLYTINRLRDTYLELIGSITAEEEKLFSKTIEYFRFFIIREDVDQEEIKEMLDRLFDVGLSIIRFKQDCSNHFIETKHTIPWLKELFKEHLLKVINYDKIKNVGYYVCEYSIAIFIHPPITKEQYRSNINKEFRGK